MLTLRTTRIVRLLCLFICITLLCLQVGPAYAAGYQAQMREAAARPKLRLPDILLRPQAKGARLAKHPAAPAGPSICLLTSKQMGQILGRGCLRNPYYSGSLPWQRSFHDVNVLNGNLFKSYTDIQASAARGSGLAMQRTYNTNDATIGPFGTGWTHSYNIQMQEASDVAAQTGNSSANNAINNVPRTDFFGGKHVYHRDADGLYSPPAYMYDELSSDYGKFLLNGPTTVLDDTDVSQDGTIKHYTNMVTNADGSSGNDRMCDYIQDCHGNRTVLAYNQSIVQADGSTRKLLTGVTDPVGHSLVFTWSNVGTTAQPAWRITQVQGPLVAGQVLAGSTYIVRYDYYTDTTKPASCYNLKDVVLDSGGLARTTTYSYTSFTGSNSNGSSTETGLISTITDPLGHVTSYTWGMSSVNNPMYSYVTASPTGTVYVVQESEPGSNGVLTYNFSFIWYSQEFGYNSSTYGNDIACQIFNNNPVYDNYELGAVFNAVSDTSLRLVAYITNNPDMGLPWGVEQKTYDANNNLIEDLGVNTVDKKYTYGQVGNVLTSWFNGYPAQSSTTYYNASQYFQKQSETDMDGHTTSYGVGTNTAGNTGDPDPNIGDRNQVLWVKDAGYADPASPSYAKEYVNTFNQYGQKLASTNLKGVVTQNAYGTANDTVDGYYDLGNLVQVVQDPGTGHLNRTTSMHYDAAGRVIQSTDPMGLTTYFTYNVLGQTLTVQTPVRGSARAETISYTYEADGRTQTVTDNRGTTSITYEDEHYNDYTNYGGRVYSVTDPITGTISYSYLLTGERSTETLPSGRVWSYYYEGEANPPGEFNGQMGSGCYYMLPKDDPNSLVRWLLCITDNQGRTVNIVHDAIGVSSCVQYNLVFNKYGATVATDDMQDVYDDGYIAEGDEGVTYPTPALSRGNLAQRTTMAYQLQSSGNIAGQTLCSNSYTYDNASNRMSNSVSVATVNSNGAVQYSGGSPTYGAAAAPAWYGHQVNGTIPNGFEDSYLPVTNQLYTSRTENYTYDDLNRLSTVSYGDGESQTYSFDSMGNRLGKTDTVTPQTGSPTTTTTTYTFDAANRITGLSTNGGTATAITSDADGNTLTDASGRTYTWDSQNRMASCTYNGTTTTFTYGADGLRRSMTANGVTTYYGYDGTMLVQEYKVNAQTDKLAATATYLPGPTGPICRVDETNQTEGYYPAGVTSTAPLGRGVTHWYVYDGLGSVIGELDDNNNLTTSRQYDVYGGPRANTLQGGAATSSQGYVGSLGHMTDAGTGGLIYMQARYYDPSLGRFVSEDPGRIGENWFGYADCNPVNKVDATGKDPVWLLIAGLIEGGIAQFCGSPYAPETIKPYVACIDALAAMVTFTNMKIQLLATIGEDDDMAGLKAVLYNAVGIGAQIACAVEASSQAILIGQMVQMDNQ